MKLQHIIVATDFSHRATRAVYWQPCRVSEHQSTPNLHVATTPPGDIAPIGGKTAGGAAGGPAEINQQMAQQIQKIRDRVGADAQPRLATGKPYMEILVWPPSVRRISSSSKPMESAFFMTCSSVQPQRRLCSG